MTPPADESIQPFRVDIPQRDVDDLADLRAFVRKLRETSLD